MNKKGHNKSCEYLIAYPVFVAIVNGKPAYRIKSKPCENAAYERGYCQESHSYVTRFLALAERLGYPALSIGALELYAWPECYHGVAQTLKPNEPVVKALEDMSP